MALPVFTVSGPAHAVDLNFLLAPPRAILRQTAAQTLTTSTDTIINFDTQDEASDATTTTGAAAKITITTAGLYEVSFVISFATNATGARLGRVTKNGLSPGTPANVLLTTDIPAPTTDGQIAASGLIRFAAADTIQLYGWQSSGGNLATVPYGGSPKFSAIFRSA